jgi:serine protease Do
MHDYSATVDKVRERIALIYVMEKDVIKSKGSGFVYWQDGTLVTCYHVVNVNYDRILIQFSNTPEGKFLDATLNITDLKHDLAILDFTDTNNKREPLETYYGEVKEGMPVFFAGYPLATFSLTSHQGILASITKDATGLATYLIDGTVNSGNSGCPLMSKDGEVIGVVNATSRSSRQDAELLKTVSEMPSGAITLHGEDLVTIHKALIKNLQLGIGHAVPCTYIPKPT